MGPRFSSRMLKREASFVKRISFSNSNASRFTLHVSRFTHITRQFSSLPLRSLDFLPARELPIKRLRPRRPLWPTGLEWSISQPKNLRGR